MSSFTRNLFLHDLLYLSYHGGLRWETKGYKEVDGRQNSMVHVHHYLLHPSKAEISQALAEVYEYAVENVELCEVMEPADFFAEAKACWECSQDIDNESFWRFTYKLFHARELYLTFVLDPHVEPKGHPLVQALDNFRDNQANIEQVEDIKSKNKEVEEKYFDPNLTHAHGEGDGDDKRVVTIVENETDNPGMDSYIGIVPARKQPEELFFFDLGPPRPPRYRDGYFEAKAAKDAKARAEEARKNVVVDQDAVLDDDDDDVMMDIDSDDEDDDMGGIIEGVQKLH
ncbi:Uu.00g128730.m01.CDS01 [Anthostomella pinea]|uniref:Uu.00g128730.m01.CDS01 n=1 Tax=Anthostomella pinea TaxID=933095 RepID=A0AAI8VIC7_9PEZI|nr:Uu.00g128730.m01.CDS01 [Anthostomella pinea]